ncbi:hypothetical protein Jiend_19820 [Micromonospora endophytica]|nr:hypothetical protein Jiend_19820 [Micromonospora endophytica]
MLAPGRRLICATCPSIQTQPSRATQAPIFWLTTRTGHGSSELLFPPAPASCPTPTPHPTATAPLRPHSPSAMSI